MQKALSIYYIPLELSWNSLGPCYIPQDITWPFTDPARIAIAIAIDITEVNRLQGPGPVGIPLWNL